MSREVLQIAPADGWWVSLRSRPATGRRTASRRPVAVWALSRDSGGTFVVPMIAADGNELIVPENTEETEFGYIEHCSEEEDEPETSVIGECPICEAEVSQGRCWGCSAPPERPLLRLS